MTELSISCLNDSCKSPQGLAERLKWQLRRFSLQWTLSLLSDGVFGKSGVWTHSKHAGKDYIKLFIYVRWWKNVIESQLLHLEVSTERAVKKTDVWHFSATGTHTTTLGYLNKAPRPTVVRSPWMHSDRIMHKWKKKKCRCQQQISLTVTHTESLPRLRHQRQTSDANQRGTCQEAVLMSRRKEIRSRWKSVTLLQQVDVWNVSVR